jgi:hypothetical protein
VLRCYLAGIDPVVRPIRLMEANGEAVPATLRLRVSGLPESAAGANGEYEPSPRPAAKSSHPVFAQVAPAGCTNFLYHGS